MPFPYQDNGSQHGKQKGTFIGNPAATHIHLVGGNDHVKVENARRYEIRWARSDDNHNPKKLADINRLREAWDDLVRVGNASPGVTECKVWLRSYLVDYHGVNPAKFG